MCYTSLCSDPVCFIGNGCGFRATLETPCALLEIDVVSEQSIGMNVVSEQPGKLLLLDTARTYHRREGTLGPKALQAQSGGRKVPGLYLPKFHARLGGNARTVRQLFQDFAVGAIGQRCGKVGVALVLSVVVRGRPDLILLACIQLRVIVPCDSLLLCPLPNRAVRHVQVHAWRSAGSALQPRDARTRALSLPVDGGPARRPHLHASTSCNLFLWICGNRPHYGPASQMRSGRRSFPRPDTKSTLFFILISRDGGSWRPKVEFSNENLSFRIFIFFFYYFTSKQSTNYALSRGVHK
jgi:hypothetical protein